MPKKAVYIPLIVEILQKHKRPMSAQELTLELTSAGNEVSECTVRKLLYREAKRGNRKVHVSHWGVSVGGTRACWYDVGCKPNAVYQPEPKRTRGRQRQLDMPEDRRALLDKYNARRRAARRADAALRIPASQKGNPDYWPKPTTEAESQTVQQALARKAAPWLPVL